MMAGGNGRRRVGRLFIIGGAEDPDDDNLRILPHLVKLAGGRRARIIVCAAATAEPVESLRNYRKVFETLGVKEVVDAAFEDREEGHDPKLMAALQRATAVFMIGGDQLRITSVLSGTDFDRGLRERFGSEGLLVAGTSAGAAAMSSTMIIRGEGGAVRRDAVELAPGLGYMRDVTIDTHFDRGGRIQRVMAIFAQNPATMGLGIDGDTAIEVVPAKRFHVIGSGTVIVFDGRVTHSNAALVAQDEPLALTDVKVHVLPDGYGFNLKTKRPIIPKQGRESGD
ncbi:MAG TPA: cyanophycinase [Gemmatimonadales bacterium]|nr:cyanophycinase [Gemmatimonadales bacterium]